MKFIVLLCTAVLCAAASTARADSMWGALSLANDGMGSWNWNRATGDGAKTEVENKCEASSKYPDTCRTVVVPNNYWTFAVQCNNGDVMQAFIEWGDTAKQAIVNVYKKAVGPDTIFGKEDCKIRAFTTGNGSHLKYKQEKEE